MTQRLAFKMQLRPGCEKAYADRHDAIWPDVKQVLKEAGVSEYSIYLDEETGILLAFQKVSGARNSQELKHHPAIQRWWEHMSDLMETNADNSPVSTPLKEVFFLK